MPPPTHATSPAKPGEPLEKPKGPAPPPPPSWTRYLLPIGIALSLFLLLRPAMQEGEVDDLGYSAFKDAVAEGRVATASIDANGGVTGELKDGTRYETQIPVAVPDDELLPLLDENRVRLTAEGPAGNTLLSVVLSFLPFLLLIGFYLYMARRAGDNWREGSGASWALEPGCTTASDRARSSAMWPATKAPSARSPRSSTS
jgi:cell division protease FtsH